MDINSAHQEEPVDQYLVEDAIMEGPQAQSKRGRSATKKMGGSSVSPSPMSKLKGTSRTRAREANKSKVSPFKI